MFFSAYCLFPVAQNDLIHISWQNQRKGLVFLSGLPIIILRITVGNCFLAIGIAEALTMDDFGK